LRSDDSNEKRRTEREISKGKWKNNKNKQKPDKL
jgi:hypothetical protein